jgi:hypothetical protein
MALAPFLLELRDLPRVDSWLPVFKPRCPCREKTPTGLAALVQRCVTALGPFVFGQQKARRLTYHYTNEDEGKTLRRYWTTACQACALKSKCTTGKERRISRWEHEAVLEAVQARLDRNPTKMRLRRQTVEHPFGTIKSWMGSTHFQMKTLKHVGTEMALHVLAYNMKRVISILGVGLMDAIRA